MSRCARLVPLIALAATAAFAQDKPRPRSILPVDRIVAVVNDEVITAYDLRDRMAAITAGLAKQGTPLPPRDVLEKQTLERIISQRVQLQFAKETAIRIDDTQLEATLGRIAQNNNLSLTQLRQAVEKDGIPFARFREEIRDEMLLARLREREVENKIVVTDGEIDLFLETEAGRSAAPDEYNLAHILVRVPERASPEQIQERQKRAEQALAQLRGGANFGQVAASFSDAPEAMQGGQLGWRDTNRLPSLFVDAVRNLRVGELTPLLRSPAGFHILQLADKRGKEATVIVQQTRARHILLKTTQILSDAEARTRLAALKERVQHGTDFGELAKLHSQDSSASQGGDLGWLSPGDTVPEFEQAMKALNPKDVSDPVRSEFGWHLIQVLERRNENMSRERQRLAARQVLRGRKSDEAFEEWVRQLRDRAYVEYRLEER